MNSPLVKLFIPFLIFLGLALGLAILGFTRDSEQTQALQPSPTQILVTADFTGMGAGEFNAAVNNLYQQGCRYYFQVDTAPGVPTGQWIEFNCNGAGASQTLILSTHDFPTPEKWNAAVAQLTNAGFVQAFWVPSAPGVFTTSWVEFYYVGAKP